MSWLADVGECVGATVGFDVGANAVAPGPVRACVLLCVRATAAEPLRPDAERKRTNSKKQPREHAGADRDLR